MERSDDASSTERPPPEGGRSRRSIISRPAVVAVLVLILGGASYRVLVRLKPLASKPIILPVPLKHFPSEVAGWVGEDRPLSPEIEKVAGNDDYLSRIYVNTTTGEVASVYVAYTGRPAIMLGHRPQVCYTTNGWISDHAPEESAVELSDGRTVPCLIHRFHQPAPHGGAIVVLNYYVLNGYPTIEESDFSGLGWRLPNVHGDLARYVAQVQISSGSEATVKNLARVIAAPILDYLPDPQGKVRAAMSPQADGKQ